MSRSFQTAVVRSLPVTLSGAAPVMIPTRCRPKRSESRGFGPGVLSCHQPSDCPQGQGNCTACHMPKARVPDGGNREGGHGVLTDHSIPRNPHQTERAAIADWRLQPFSPPGYRHPRIRAGLCGGCHAHGRSQPERRSGPPAFSRASGRPSDDMARGALPARGR